MDNITLVSPMIAATMQSHAIWLLHRASDPHDLSIRSCPQIGIGKNAGSVPFRLKERQNSTGFEEEARRSKKI